MRDTALRDCLRGEEKNAASRLSVGRLCSLTGLVCVLAHLGKSYAVDDSAQSYSILLAVLNYIRDKTLTLCRFGDGFHARHDKIEELEFLASVQGHFILRDMRVEQEEQNTIIWKTSGG